MARDLIASDAAIRAIKAGDARRRLNDGDGLHLLLFVKGGAHGWRLAYTLNGRRNILSLGTYPATGLALARRKAEQARRLVREGVDPSATRKDAKAEAARRREVERRAAAGLPPEGSFEAVAREWLAMVHAAEVTAGHAARTGERLARELFPWIGRRPIAEIDAAELLACLRRVEARGAVETAHRVKSAAGQVFRYGIITNRCARNPAADLRGAMRSPSVRHLAAIVDPKDAGHLLRAMREYRGHPVTRAALMLSALLFLRPGELRRIEWAWVDFDAAMVTVPAAAMKGNKAAKAAGAPHLVPLAPQSMAILRELQPLTCGDGRRYVFPSLLTGERPMSENTVTTALRRLGFARGTATAHGFRAMARTMIAERLGVAPEVIEAQLAHAVPDALGRAYNRTQYLEQRRAMMKSWADYLDKLGQAGGVLPFRAA